MTCLPSLRASLVTRLNSSSLKPWQMIGVLRASATGLEVAGLVDGEVALAPVADAVGLDGVLDLPFLHQFRLSAFRHRRGLQGKRVGGRSRGPLRARAQDTLKRLGSDQRGCRSSYRPG